MDQIVVIKDGTITESGTFKQLMKNRGHLSQLVGEHVQIIEEEEEPEPCTQSDASADEPAASTNLNSSQINNRRRLSLNRHIKTTDENLAIHIENSQFALMGGHHLRQDSIKVFERNRMSVVTIDNEDATVVPSDAEPMKLVLEDQSIYYKVPAILSYLKAGTGVVLTVLLFAFFFLVHGVRIGSGKIFLFIYLLNKFSSNSKTKNLF